MEQSEYIIRTIVESLPNSWLDYLSAACLFLTLIVAAISALYAKKTYEKHEARSKKESACDLAKRYADEFIPKCQYITMVMKDAGIMDYVKNAFPLNELNHFDERELKAILEKHENLETDADKIHTKIDPAIIFSRAQYLFDDIISSDLINDSNLSSIPSPNQLDDAQKVFLQRRFEMEINRLLNWLEWFALNARYRIVDEEILFQSLHQTYIAIVWQFYYYIAKANKNSPGDKYYTNLIWLFLTWLKRLNTIKDKAEKNTIAANKINDQMRDHEYSGSPI